MLPSVVTKTNPVPFIQPIQGTNVVSVPTYRDVVLQSQVVMTNASAYLDFHIPGKMNSNLNHVRYALSNINTPDFNSATIAEMDTLLWKYSIKTYAVDRINGKMCVITQNENLHPTPLNQGNWYITSTLCQQRLDLDFDDINNTLHRQGCPQSALSRAPSVSLEDFLREKWVTAYLDCFVEKKFVPHESSLQHGV